MNRLNTLFAVVGVAATLLISTGSAFAHTLGTPRTVTNGNDTLRATVTVAPPVEGELYAMVAVGEAYFFFDPQGGLVAEPIPVTSGALQGSYHLFSYTSESVPPGKWRIYTIITTVGGNPFDVTTWVGGFSGLRTLMFHNGLPSSISGDHDGDGHPDDDSDGDGYHDDDHDRDGEHDEDDEEDDDDDDRHR